MFDLIVIGAGSGGIATARRAAKYGAKVMVVEAGRLGGTCVNLGCVPKKVMWSVASVREFVSLSGYYGTTIASDSLDKFNWLEVKQKRDAYVLRLNEIYNRNLENDGIKLVHGMAKLRENNQVQVNEQIFRGKHILIATGSAPVFPTDVPGYEHGISSDGFFELTEQPRDVAIIGSGYIAAELAGIFAALGSKVSIWCRQDRIMTHFDRDIAVRLQEEMEERSGIVIHKLSCVRRVIKDTDGSLSVEYTDCVDGVDTSDHRKTSSNHDCLVWAIGRRAKDTAGAKEIGIKFDEAGNIIVNDKQECNLPGYYAVGDVTGHVQLTPVAISAGRLLADRLFGDKPEAKLDYSNIPSVVFSHPPIGTVGLSEEQARAKYEKVRVYQKEFLNMFYALIPVEQRPKATLYKMITVGEGERIVGLHMIGLSSDEILQGAAIAIKMGASKADFDACVAIHPTASEELVYFR